MTNGHAPMEFSNHFLPINVYIGGGGLGVWHADRWRMWGYLWRRYPEWVVLGLVASGLLGYVVTEVLHWEM